MLSLPNGTRVRLTKVPISIINQPGAVYKTNRYAAYYLFIPDDQDDATGLPWHDALGEPRSRGFRWGYWVREFQVEVTVERQKRTSGFGKFIQRIEGKKGNDDNSVHSS